MQLLFKRHQNAGVLGRTTFRLWARIALSPEEKTLLAKYRVSDAILADGDRLRDLHLAAKYAVAFGFIATIVSYFDLLYFYAQLGFRVGPAGAALAGLITFAVATYVIYHQIREEIRISDILAGRLFACRSVILLKEKERTVAGMAKEFREFLEDMKTWGGADIIDIEPGQIPTLRVIEPRHAAA